MNPHQTSQLQQNSPASQGQLEQHHLLEWLNSGVSLELIAANVTSLDERSAFEALCYSDKLERRNDGRLSNKWLNRYKHLQHGGWGFTGIDVLTGEKSLWGCVKPDQPRIDPAKGKAIKYEHPPKIPTEIFAYDVPRELWYRLAIRYEVALPEDDSVNFWQWVQNTPKIPLVITEGAKKAGSLLSLGYAAIALPGIYNGIRTPKDEFGNKIGKPRLIPQLQAFAQKEREIYFAFDQDQKLSTQRHVINALTKTGSLFSVQGCPVKVIEWDGKQGKGVDDFIVTQGLEAFQRAFHFAFDLEIWRTKQVTKLTYEVDLLLNSRYLGNFAPPPEAKLICLKSPKGTGKTQWLSRLVAEIIKTGESRILLLTHRIQLGSELCNRLGIDYVTEIRDSDTGGVLGYGLCLDSLHSKSIAHFNPQDWHGATVIIDEAEQVVWHGLNSSTCQRERVTILRNLEQVIQNALASGGRIYLSDADLCDISIDYVRSLAGFDLKPWVCVNSYKPEKPWKVHNYGGKNPKQLVANLERHLSQGNKALLCLSGQKKKSKWGTQVQEKYFKGKFPKLRILRIDAESVSDPNHPAYGCIDNLNQLLLNYDLVIVSPTIETGVSIDITGHFDSVWCIAQGVQAVNSVCQFLARHRASVDRHIWAASRGLNFVGNGSTSVKGLLAAEHQKTKAHINLLTKAGFSDDIETNSTNFHLITWAKRGAAHNLGMKNYRQSIIQKLKDEGHIIIDAQDIDEEKADEVKAQVTQARDEIYQQHCELLAAAQDIDERRFLELKDKRAKTESERLEYQKASLARRYGVEVKPELVVKNDNGWHSQIKLHYALTKGREFVTEKDIAKARSQLEQGFGSIFKPDFNRSQMGLKIAVLERMGFSRLLEQREFRASDPDVQEIHNFCNKTKWQIRAILGLTPSADKPMVTICSLLAKIGYRLPYLRREGSRGNRVRVYGTAAPEFLVDEDKRLILDTQGRAIPISDGREEVFAAWRERDLHLREQTQASLASTPVSTEVSVIEHGGENQKNVSDDTVSTEFHNSNYYNSMDTQRVDTNLVDTEQLEDDELARSAFFSKNSLLAALNQIPRSERYSRMEALAPELLANYPDWRSWGCIPKPIMEEDTRQLRDKDSKRVYPVSVLAQLLAEAAQYGKETIRALIEPWQLCERWNAINYLKEKMPSLWDKFEAVAPDWNLWSEFS